MSSERMTDHLLRTTSNAARRAAERPAVIDIAPVLEAAAAGDPQAWETLIHQFSGLITSVTWSYHLSPADAADVAQSVWLSLFENIGRIREPQALAGWIRTVAQNACRRLLRRAGRELPTIDVDMVEPPEPVEDKLLEAQRKAALARALETLPVRQRSLMQVLIQDPAPSYEAASNMLGMAIGSVGPTRQRSIDRLRSHVELIAL
jgi:RNA polymerase sigma factor (sigma-70 family)